MAGRGRDGKCGVHGEGCGDCQTSTEACSSGHSQDKTASLVAPAVDAWDYWSNRKATFNDPFCFMTGSSSPGPPALVVAAPSLPHYVVTTHS